jgi:DeoC/LacD family aldolase
MTELSAGKYWRMRRLADYKGRYKMMAIDQRVLIAEPLAKRLGVSKATHGDISRFKEVVVEMLAPHVSALLLDPYYGYPGAIHVLPASCGLLTAAEDAPPRKDAEGALYTDSNSNWSVAKAVRAGSDAIKLLVFYRPDAPRAGTSRISSGEWGRRAGNTTFLTSSRSSTILSQKTLTIRSPPMRPMAIGSSRASRPSRHRNMESTSSRCRRLSRRHRTPTTHLRSRPPSGRSSAWTKHVVDHGFCFQPASRMRSSSACWIWPMTPAPVGFSPVVPFGSVPSLPIRTPRRCAARCADKAWRICSASTG